ncbi:hypothetical protein BGX38DRAFT_1164097 [Terfezia claveryi]|nr:hypothetical protein BGX38DRAFT_1164097 [Terfezia claveryi]
MKAWLHHQTLCSVTIFYSAAAGAGSHNSGRPAILAEIDYSNTASKFPIDVNVGINRRARICHPQFVSTNGGGGVGIN